VSEESAKSTRKPPYPAWLDFAVKGGGLVAVLGALYVIGLLYYGIHPQAMDIGYEPQQPVPYSHALHAGDLGIDCRYCHNTVDVSAFASVPPTQTCMNCHANIRPESEMLLAVRESHASGMPVEWIRVHDLPDFVYFNHSAHVTRGVGCVECHGRVDKMETVNQDQPLSMAWCLSCHRHPDEHLRPLDQITNMAWQPPEGAGVVGAQIRQAFAINPPTDCSTCHR
jgi:hypothetical protein